MAKEKLPEGIVNEVIRYFNRHLEDSSVAPNKVEFFKAAVVRADFLPSSVQAEIEARRGNGSQVDYLMSHDSFINSFGHYWI